MSALKVVTIADYVSALDRGITAPHAVAALPKGGDPDIARVVSECDVLVSATCKASWLSPSGRGPRLVQSTGAGLDGIDIAALPAGCRVCNVYGHERGVAEQAFLHILALHKGLFALDSALRRGNWTPQRKYLTELRGRRLLILGMGHIGAELARWGRFFLMEVEALTRTPGKARAQPEAPCPVRGLGELRSRLPHADFVVVAIPATPQTTDLIGEAELALMKPSAFIVNVGRGPVINEAALFQALRSKRIAGAGLDVWYQYPVPGQDLLPAHLPFHELDNVIMTPHKPTEETMSFRLAEIAKNVDRFARGEPLENQVVP